MSLYGFLIHCHIYQLWFSKRSLHVAQRRKCEAASEDRAHYAVVMETSFLIISPHRDASLKYTTTSAIIVCM